MFKRFCCKQSARYILNNTHINCLFNQVHLFLGDTVDLIVTEIPFVTSLFGTQAGKSEHLFTCYAFVPAQTSQLTEKMNKSLKYVAFTVHQKSIYI